MESKETKVFFFNLISTGQTTFVCHFTVRFYDTNMPLTKISLNILMLISSEGKVMAYLFK